MPTCLLNSDKLSLLTMMLSRDKGTLVQAGMYSLAQTTVLWVSRYTMTWLTTTAR